MAEQLDEIRLQAKQWVANIPDKVQHLVNLSGVICTNHQNRCSEFEVMGFSQPEIDRLLPLELAIQELRNFLNELSTLEQERKLLTKFILTLESDMAAIEETDFYKYGLNNG